MSSQRERAVITSLGESGTRLWDEFTTKSNLTEDDRVVLLEACRLADRCDRLALLASGDVDTWARVDFSHGEVAVVVDRVLAEARQHSLALTRLLTHLRQATKAAEVPATGGGKVPDGVVSLTDRVAAKRASASG